MQLTPRSRKAYIQYNELLAHIDARRHREEQCTRGYRDDDGKWYGGLYAFVKYFWHILEPETPFVPGWSMEAICEHLEAVTYGEINRLLINVPPGFCKALDDDTPILTTDGWKRHGDLKAGDFVFGADGKPKRILAVSAVRHEDGYEVEFDDGAKIVAAGDHLWAVERDVPSVKPKYRRGRKAMVVRTSELRVGNDKKRPDRIAICQPVETPSKRLLIDPYLLGAWLGDGATGSGCLYAAEQDIGHFRKLGEIAHIQEPTGGRKQRFYRIRIDGLQVRLRILGLLGNKHIPDDYLEASQDQRWELLRGLMDTDGTATIVGHCSFVTKLKHLAEQVRQLACSLGIKAHLSEQWSSINGVRFGPYWNVLFTAPSHTRIFNLERKQKRISTPKNARSRCRYVKAVTNVGMRSLRCIQVEDSLYLAGKQFVVTHNSLLVDVFWPAWEWACCNKSHLRYVTFSYSASLTERDNRRFGDLVTSKEFRDLYGKKVKIVKKGDTLVTNTRKGWKLASSVGGVGTGERGDRIILDDPHNVKEAESDIVRSETVRWFRESMSNRLNDMDRGAIVIIMQRVHEDDVSGVLLSLGLEYCHLMIPMEYDSSRALDDNGELITTQIGWVDPRCVPTAPETNDGALAWIQRFPEHVIDRTKKEVGPYAWAGQYQQSPAPRGGGIFKTQWWQVWESPDGKFPIFDLVIASVDSAFTANEMNDPTGLTIWGVFYLDGKRRLMLVHAWRKHLAFSGVRAPYEPGESKAQWQRRTQPTWGLMEWVQYTCERFKVDKLLIEAKASGISAAQELRNRYGMQDWVTQLCPVKGDKVARATAVQAVFANLGVYTPIRDWSDMVIQEMSVFPAGRYDDLTDSATQAVKWLRDNGMAPTDAEILYQQEEEIKLKPKAKSLYPV